MTVRAKLHVSTVTNHEWGGKTRRFETRYDDTIREDQRFQKDTHSGHAELMIDNPTALAQFELGKDYYVDFFSSKAGRLGVVGVCINRIGMHQGVEK
jgi:hypothetical protein